MNNADMLAYPLTEEQIDRSERGNGYEGLTKREYFAGLAMQGLLSGIPADGVISYEEVADDARRCADALLKELDKEKKK